MLRATNKRMTVQTLIPSRQSPSPRPGMTPEQIRAWADQVVYGQVVTTDLNDGSFVALMAELRRRGYAPVNRTPIERELKPFIVKVNLRSGE